jgi:hypothetical protein
MMLMSGFALVLQASKQSIKGYKYTYIQSLLSHNTKCWDTVVTFHVSDYMQIHHRHKKEAEQVFKTMSMKYSTESAF